MEDVGQEVRFTDGLDCILIGIVDGAAAHSKCPLNQMDWLWWFFVSEFSTVKTAARTFHYFLYSNAIKLTISNIRWIDPSITDPLILW